MHMGWERRPTGITTHYTHAAPLQNLVQIDGTVPGSHGSTTGGTNPSGGDGPGQAGLPGPSLATTGGAWQPPQGVPSTAPPSSGPPQGTIPRGGLPTPLLTTTTTTPPRTTNAAASGGGVGVSSEPAAVAGGAGWEARSRALEGLPDPLSLTGLTFEGVFSPSQVSLEGGGSMSFFFCRMMREQVLNLFFVSPCDQTGYSCHLLVWLLICALWGQRVIIPQPGHLCWPR